MEQQRATELVLENLQSIYRFSMARLYDKTEAEDLANDILYEILKSAHRLKDDKAFYGFMWRIADNTFKRHLRSKRSHGISESGYTGVYWDTPESEVIHREELQLLRRELALLSSQYREATVAYYIRNKSCAEIAHDLRISVEMVKYYLFKTRKILKEGVEMTREFGEKSYHPGTFQMDFWGGGDNSRYWALFKRKLPGNIVLAAYDAPLTMQELSLELGVAVVYLEEEVQLLLQEEILRKNGDRCQTNIVLFTGAYEKRLSGLIRPIYEAFAQEADDRLCALLPRLKELDFDGRTVPDNDLKWIFWNLALMMGLRQADNQGRQRFGDYPPLTNGSYGFVFGYDNDYQYHHFNGIYGHCENRDHTAYFSAVNYRILPNSQQWKPDCWDKAVQAMTDAILRKAADEDNDQLIRLIEEGAIACDNGRLSANFPVFSAAVLEQAQGILAPLAEKISGCMMEICETAAKTLRDTLPKSLSEKGDQLAFIHHQMDVMAFIMETLVDKGRLHLPESGQKACILGVIR